RKHENIPRRQHLLVASWFFATFPYFEEPAAAIVDNSSHTRRVDLVSGGKVVDGRVYMQDVMTFEIALSSDIEVVAEDRAVTFTQRGNDFFSRPDEELAFDAFRISVSARIEAASRIRHLANNIIERLGRNASGEF